MKWKESEIIDLASEGVFYPSDHPFSKGYIKIYPLTGRCEDILCNSTLNKRGLTLETIFSEVLEEDVDFKTILQCDIDTILLNLKIIAYGSESNYKITCSTCDDTSEIPISFAFKGKDFNASDFTKGKNEISYLFPICDKRILFRLPTHEEHKILRNNGWLTFIKNQTISVEGIDDLDYFFDYDMPIKDGKSLKSYYENNTPGFKTKIKIKCPACETETPFNVDIDSNIFGYTPSHKRMIHTEIFDLCYHSNGAFTQESVYNMPVNTRQFYVKSLLDVKLKEKESNSPKSNQTKVNPDIPNRPKVKK